MPLKTSSGSVPKTLRIAVAGASGRMGRALIAAIIKTEGVLLQGALIAQGSSLIGSDAGTLIGAAPLGILLTDHIEQAVRECDIMIDFSTPLSTLHHLSYCAQQGVPLVIGTTGFDQAAITVIKSAAEQIGVVLAANFSVGINLLYQLLIPLTQVMGEQSDIEIIEMHHRNKVDAPSGTALALANVIAQVQGNDFLDYKPAGGNRIEQKKNIGFSVVRAGDIIGDHTVLFAGTGECLTITHHVTSRMPFATGAVRAACWLKQQSPALYDMQDVLGLRSRDKC